MFNGILLMIFLILGVFLGVLYNKYFVKDYPDYKKKLGYFFTLIAFVAVFLSIYSVISIKYYVITIIREYSIKLEQYIKDNNPENELVKNGIDLTQLNDSLTQIDNGINEIKNLLPDYKELGVDKFIYDLIVDYAIKQLQKKMKVVNYYTYIVNTFTEKNNIITVSSLINGLRANAIKLINTISLIIVIIFLVAFFVYIIYTLTIITRERKYKKI
jgi:disulfide bond formation protein DsbB